MLIPTVDIGNLVGFALETNVTRKTMILSQHDGFDIRQVEETKVEAITGKVISNHYAKCYVFDDGSLMYIPIKRPFITANIQTA